METTNFGRNSDGTEVIKVHDAVTADVAAGDSAKIPCAGVKAASIVFTEGGTVNNRSGVLTVQISYDGGETFHATNMLIDNVTNTNAQQVTRVASKTRAAAGSDVLHIDPLAIHAATHLKLPLDITDGGAPTGNFTTYLTLTY